MHRDGKIGRVMAELGYDPRIILEDSWISDAPFFLILVSRGDVLHIERIA